MTASTGHDASGYWYSDEQKARRATAVLNAMRSYRSAEIAMRKRAQLSMKMGETDLAAVRLVLESRARGHDISPKDLARTLHISTASTTLLVDRLVLSGHVERRPHPTDRRSVVVIPTASTDVEVKSTLGDMHSQMMVIAKELSTADAAAILTFLARMSHVVSGDSAAGVAR